MRLAHIPISMSGENKYHCTYLLLNATLYVQQIRIEVFIIFNCCCLFAIYLFCISLNAFLVLSRSPVALIYIFLIFWFFRNITCFKVINNRCLCIIFVYSCTHLLYLHFLLFSLFAFLLSCISFCSYILLSSLGFWTPSILEIPIWTPCYEIPG